MLYPWQNDPRPNLLTFRTPVQFIHEIGLTCLLTVCDTERNGTDTVKIVELEDRDPRARVKRRSGIIISVASCPGHVIFMTAHCKSLNKLELWNVIMKWWHDASSSRAWSTQLSNRAWIFFSFFFIHFFVYKNKRLFQFSFCTIGFFFASPKVWEKRHFAIIRAWRLFCAIVASFCYNLT